MPQYKDKLNSDGGLNLDAAVENLKAGDYPDALDVSFLSDFTGGSNNITPKLGNEYAFDIGSVSAQNKKYGLYIDLVNSGTLSYQITFYKTDTTTALFSATFTNGSLTVADNAISNAAAAAGYGINIVNNGVYLLIEFAPMSGGVPTNYYDYYINDTGTDALEDLYVYQEAIDLTLVGENRAIGSYDLLGDLFIWSTSQTELPSDLEAVIYSITHTTVLTNITIDFTSAHGLNTGERILVQGVEVLTGANGYWIVIATSTTQIQLAMSETVPQLGQIFTGTGSITINPSGIGEIGVAQKVQSTQAWQYRRLLRSKEWNFITKKQIDTHIEQNSFRKSIYWTDDYNVPRAMYYEGDYLTGGGISYNGGLYEYDGIAQETILSITGINLVLTFTGQTQFGGALTSGNKTYSARLLTESLAATDWLPSINPIPVYVADENGSAYQLLGDVAGTATSKLHNFLITGIIPGVFKYVELACTEYAGLSVNTYIVRRDLITSSSMELLHTGFEVTETIISGSLGVTNNTIATAKNIRAIDNRLILSNITEGGDIVLTDWAEQITHGIFRQSIVGWQYLSQTIGEFQDVDTCHNYIGYMINETYRFGVRVLLKTGQWSRVFFVQDIKIDDDATYPRRTQALTDYNLTDNSLGGNVYVPYIQFGNIDMEYLVNGVPLKHLIDAISFVRADVIPEVVASGIVIVSETHGTTSGFPGANYYSNSLINESLFLQDSNSALDEWRGSCGMLLTQNDTDPSNNDIANPPLDFSVNSQYVSFYAPDILFGHTEAQQLSGQKLIVYGATQGGTFFTGTNIGWQPSYFRNNFVENITTPITYDVDELKNIGMFGSETFSTGQRFNKYYDAEWTNFSAFVPIDKLYGLVGSPVMRLSSPIVNNNTNTDYGIYYAQLFNIRNDKYGTAESTVYISCGHNFQTSGQSGIVGGISVFGGDTLTQRTYFKNRHLNSETVPLWATVGVNNFGSGNGTIIFSQNRINSQLRYDTTPQILFPYNTQNPYLWLEQTEAAQDLFSYDEGYTPQNTTAVYVAYDVNTRSTFDLPCRIRWSELKPQDAISDYYRYFLSLNFKDLDNSFGEINHHENVNGELFTIQSKKWQRQYFNTRGTLDVRGVSDVLIGDGSVMSRDGQTISNFGCQNKWSVIKGKSQGGNDTIYWIDLINKQAIRFGSDGTIGLSTIKGLQSFLANNLTWATSNDTPADGQGIHGWWHERFKEAIWVVRATRGVAGNLLSTQPVSIPQDWSATTNFVLGNVVYYASGTPNDFNEGQVFYRSLHNNNLGNLPTNVGWWEQISITDTDYYNYYSVAFNELKNRFTSFYTPLPKIAMQWNNGYLTPRPVGTQSRVYEHNKGEYSTWYAEGVDELTSEPYVDVIYNKDNSLSKSFLAFIATCQDVPYKVTFYTQNHETTSVAIDFKQYPTPPDFATAIKNDVLNTIAPPIGYSKLWGVWVKCRFYFANRTFNSLDGCVIKFTSINPIYQK